MCFALRLSRILPGAATEAIPVAAGTTRGNGHVESCHSRLSGECLEPVEFEHVAGARAMAPWHLRELNAFRPYASVGCATLKEFR
jgi:hypothetical protein